MLPPSLTTFTLHTYSFAARLAGIVEQLGPLQSQGLQNLNISCPVGEHGMWRTGQGGPNSEYIKLRSRSEPFASLEQDIFVQSSGGLPCMMMLLRCRGLQCYGSLTLAEVADKIRGPGLMRLIDSQILKVWDQEAVFGEALLSVFDNEAAGARKVEEMPDLAEAFSTLFGETAEE
jgi:hypothetical protein